MPASPPATRTCPACGAAATAEAVRYCAYCAAELPPVPIPERLGGDTAARFEALRAHVLSAPTKPEKPILPLPVLGARRSRDSFEGAAVLAVPLVCMGLLGLLYVLAIGRSLIREGGMLPWLFLGTVGVTAAIAVVVSLVGSNGEEPGLREPESGPRGYLLLDRVPSSDGPGYEQVTLEHEDGSRVRAGVYASGMGDLAPGDMFVGWLRGSELIGVRRVAV